MAMNSRDRVLSCLNFEQPDRPPVFASYVPEIEQVFRKTKGINSYDLGVALGNDMVKSCAGLEKSFYGQPYPEYTDNWGIRWKYSHNNFGVFTEIAEHPLAGSTDKLSSYKIPDPLEESQYDDFRMKKRLYGDKKFIIGSSQISIFEACWYLRGLEQFMMDMLLEPDYANALMDKVMQFPLKASLKYIEFGADMVWFGDDISMQTGMMMSIDIWRKYFKPRYATLFAACKKANPDIKIAYHSCGNCSEILSDMIEIGLDVLNPIQPMAINPFEVKKKFGKHLVLFGGICVQKLMPYGSTQEIQDTVRKMKKECGKGGGYICAPAHHIQADTSIENIMSFYSEGLKADLQALSIPIQSLKNDKKSLKSVEKKSQQN